VGVKAPPRIVHFRNIQPGAGRTQFVLPAAMILIGIVSVQFGAGLADRLFGQVPPAAVTGLRLWTSALAMVVISGRGFTRSVRDLKKRRAAADAAIAIAFGISLGVMNYSIYQSFARIPLGVAVTIEFLGPLAVAVAGSRHLRDVGWVVLAGAGVVLLTQGGHGDLNLAGVLFAGLAAACWAAYIVLNRLVGARLPGLQAPAAASSVAALLYLPVAAVLLAQGRFDAAAVGYAVGAGVLSSVVPYAGDLVALRFVPARFFGVFMSIHPVLAALAGLVILGERLRLHEWAGITVVVLVNAAQLLARRRTGRQFTR
jgi:threonine/homoserine efflux transporter RhtA